MKIGIANDHRGYILKMQLKLYLKDKGYEVIDYGTESEDSVDYPIYAFKVGEAVQKKEIDRGILICGTGIGMSIAANKVNGVRCAKVDTAEEAKLTRIDNDSNVLAFGYKKEIDVAKDIVDTFLNTETSTEERHIRRVHLIDNYRN